MLTRSEAISLLFAPLCRSGLLLGRPPRPKPHAHFYYVDDAEARRSFGANVHRMDLVSPAWLSVDPKGQLRSTADPAFVRTAAARSLPLMPILVNENFKPEIAGLVLTDDGVQRSLVESIAAMAARHRLRGIQLDFEDVGPLYRDAFTAFASELSGALRRVGRTLTIAVPAPLIPMAGPETEMPTWTPNPRAAAFDYKRLAEVSDWLTLMAYDEYTWSGSPGPVSGLPWVQACLEKLLQEVPPQRVSLGVPFYYRRWAGSSVTVGRHSEASALSARFQAPAAVHKLQQENAIKFTEGSTPNVVWFNDAQTLRARVALVHRYGLAGFSAWRLGQEDPDVWRFTFPDWRSHS